MKELRKKSDKDLAKLLVEKQEALRAFRFGISGSKMRNMKEGAGIKKEIARIKTLMRERENA